MQTVGATLHPIIKAKGEQLLPQQDAVAVEEPLQIELRYKEESEDVIKKIAVTMRTPGNDEELAAGFLFTEAILRHHKQIAAISHFDKEESCIAVSLKDNTLPQLEKSERGFYATSSCGVCGKTSIDSIRTISPFNTTVHFTVKKETLYSLQSELIKQQSLFESTGGLHAAALFSIEGKCQFLREDIGRHNAVDKIIGTAFLGGQLPLSNNILLLSGRAGFELIQKAAMAGIQMIAAIGAPSSLAVKMAMEKEITLIGFLRNNTMNIYCGHQRIK